MCIAPFQYFIVNNVVYDDDSFYRQTQTLTTISYAFVLYCVYSDIVIWSSILPTLNSTLKNLNSCFLHFHNNNNNNNNKLHIYNRIISLSSYFFSIFLLVYCVSIFFCVCQCLFFSFFFSLCIGASS